MFKKFILIILGAVLCLGGCSSRISDTKESTDNMNNISSTADINDSTKEISYEKIKLTDFDSLLLSGRIITDEEGMHLDWTYSGFTFRGWFDGKIYADVNAVGQLGYLLHVEVDGSDRAIRYGLGEGKIELADVEKGYHTVTVRKATEGCTTTVTFRSLEFTGKLDTKPEAPNLKIEVVGDSISCGVGAKSENVTAEDWDYIRDCDSFNSYSTIVARELGADIHLTSVSGWGVIHGSTGSDQKTPDIYEYTSYIRDRETKWDFSSYQPDIIIIGLGTNDVNAPDLTGYKDAASAFLKIVREKNPDAYIIWIYGMMNMNLRNEIKAAVEEQVDDRIIYMDMLPDASGGWGHPSLTMQKLYAKKLVSALKPVLGK